MSLSTRFRPPSEIVYPDSDGQPMAENTLQFEWIVTIKGGLDAVFAARPDVFVAGDLFWYPVEGEPGIRTAPDAMVVFDRPKGHRSSYKQWEEEGVAPQVVFEILSPGNSVPEMVRKEAFYDRYGVEEYYLYDPDGIVLVGWLRDGQGFRLLGELNGWTSPRLGVRFDLAQGDLKIYGPDGEPFLTYAEVVEARDNEKHRADELSRRADEQSRRADEQSRRADEQSRRADEQSRRADELARERDELAARLRELGDAPGR